ncbi:unnamed protein product [Mytilus edulis]|uniref:Uncharacterized protein n=1 Tax=Mytilus edulis TaxID=6550 RepID=A0A8S3U8N0_MYTED|nr:unnamed protein product [Mytilus edulis]
MPSGNIVFVDQNNDRLIIHNENGLFVCEIPVSHWPVDVTCIDKNTVAVTHNAGSNHIEIINIVNKKIVNQIKTSNLCYGITNEKGELIYYEKGRGIQTADVNSKSTATTVVKVDGEQYWNYVTTSKGKIYHTNSESGIVTCYRCFTGQKVWEYKDESVVESVYGVAVDNDSNVYVVSNENNSIVVLSPDGKHACRLLGRLNGIQCPCGIYFDKRRNILLVTNLCGTAFLYKNIK